MTSLSEASQAIGGFSYETLEGFIIDRQEMIPHSTGEFSQILRDIGLAAKIVSREMRRAGLNDVYGTVAEENVHGEQQKKLDVYAHREFVRALSRGGECGLIGSEESTEPIRIQAPKEGSGKYIVLLDPLDGSSNIDINSSVATIFSIYRKPDNADRPELEHALQPGTEQVGAGYVIYGSSTMLVYTTGRGVNGFTLDPSIGEFLLSHPNVTIPKKGDIYSINEGQRRQWPRGVRTFVDWTQNPVEQGGEPFTARYTGALVADVHRILIKGGIFCYPSTPSRPEGKLRLMYEANPLAFVVEQAQGRASDGSNPILDITPDTLHQKIPLFLGSRELVNQLERFIAEADDQSGKR